MRKLTLVVSMLFSAVSIAGAQGTTPGDTTTVADVRSKAETVSTVAVITAPNTTPAPVRTGFGKRVVDRKGTKKTLPVTSKTTTTVTTSSAPVSTTVKTETEINAENQKLAAEIEKSNAPPAVKMATATLPKESAKPVSAAKKDVVQTASKKSRPGTGHPFTLKTDQLGLVNAVRTCNRKVLIVRCDDLLSEFNRVIGKRFDRHFASLDQVASFLADAEEGACPAGETANLSRVLGTRVREKDTWERSFEPGERCLSVDNLIILSLRCGNPVKSTHYLRAPRQEAAEPPRTEKKVAFMPPKEPLGTVTTPEYKKRGWSTTKKVVVGGIVTAALAEAACLIDEDLCLLRIKMHQSQKQSQ